MDDLGITCFRVIASIGTFFIVWLIMGQRQVGEFSPLEFIISITAGAVAGAAIVDHRIELGSAVIALILLGILQIVISTFAIKNRFFHRRINYKPVVLVENGQIIKKSLARVRITVETLLQLLREKEVFDVTEVEIAILEPHGKLSVLKKAEYQPVTPQTLKLEVKPNNILVPVILEGVLQHDTLKSLGFSSDQIEAFQKENSCKLSSIFVAFMNNKHELYIVDGNQVEKGRFGL